MFCVRCGCSLVDLFAFGCLVVLAWPGGRGNPGLREDAQTRPPSRDDSPTRPRIRADNREGADRGQIRAIWCAPGCIEGVKRACSACIAGTLWSIFLPLAALWSWHCRAGEANRAFAKTLRPGHPAAKTLRPGHPAGRGRRGGLDVCASVPNLIRGNRLSSLLTTFSLRSQSEY